MFPARELIMRPCVDCRIGFLMPLLLNFRTKPKIFDRSSFVFVCSGNSGIRSDSLTYVKSTNEGKGLPGWWPTAFPTLSRSTFEFWKARLSLFVAMQSIWRCIYTVQRQLMTLNTTVKLGFKLLWYTCLMRLIKVQIV